MFDASRPQIELVMMAGDSIFDAIPTLPCFMKLFNAPIRVAVIIIKTRGIVASFLEVLFRCHPHPPF